LIYSPPPTLCVDIPLFSSTPPNDEMAIHTRVWKVEWRQTWWKDQGIFSGKKTENHSKGKK